ncbi:hypothetical protein CYMTET_23896 [Cymbomonas tetramitiformis]|uniref:Cadherin-like beta-sandwich-like domain-containing protein n=1 Tax=Cymbomonas tetramitiformis TaxID=36881 RepID=A0AAE0L0N1_9CHLO|nr:hypothetical protein CYMTET_23896 [Cymbomonas tetramitiformis]
MFLQSLFGNRGAKPRKPDKPDENLTRLPSFTTITLLLFLFATLYLVYQRHETTIHEQSAPPQLTSPPPLISTAALAVLSLSTTDLRQGFTLVPAFESEVYSYTLAQVLGARTSAVAVGFVTRGPHAVVTVRVKQGSRTVYARRSGSRTLLSSGTEYDVPIAYGNSTVIVQAESQDHSHEESYRILVSRQEPGEHAQLQALEVSAGTLEPKFSPAQSTYTLLMEGDTRNIALTPVLLVEKARTQVRVNGARVAHNASVEVTLDYMWMLNFTRPENRIEVEVRAEWGLARKVYTIVALYNSPNLPNPSPPGSPPLLHHLPPPPPPLPALPQPRSYLAVLTCHSQDLRKNWDLDPAFQPDVLQYNIHVDFRDHFVAMSYVTQGPDATVEFHLDLPEDRPVPLSRHLLESDTTEGIGPLREGTNRIRIEVTSQDGASRTVYQVLVTRTEDGSMVALQRLHVSNGTLVPPFEPRLKEYTLVLDDGTDPDFVTVTPHLFPAAIARGVTIEVGHRHDTVVTGTASLPQPLSGMRGSVNLSLPIILWGPHRLVHRIYHVTAVHTPPPPPPPPSPSPPANTTPPPLPPSPRPSRPPSPPPPPIPPYVPKVPDQPGTPFVLYPPWPPEGELWRPEKEKPGKAQLMWQNLDAIDEVRASMTRTQLFELEVHTANGVLQLEMLPAFHPEHTVYNVSVPYSVDDVTFMARSKHKDVVVRVNEWEARSGLDTKPFPLDMGRNNPFRLVITQPATDVAELSVLGVSGSMGVGRLTPRFNPRIFAYTVEVHFDVKEVNVAFLTRAPGASVDVRLHVASRFAHPAHATSHPAVSSSSGSGDAEDAPSPHSKEPEGGGSAAHGADDIDAQADTETAEGSTSRRPSREPTSRRAGSSNIGRRNGADREGVKKRDGNGSQGSAKTTTGSGGASIAAEHSNPGGGAKGETSTAGVGARGSGGGSSNGGVGKGRTRVSSGRQGSLPAKPGAAPSKSTAAALSSRANQARSQGSRAQAPPVASSRLGQPPGNAKVSENAVSGSGGGGGGEVSAGSQKLPAATTTAMRAQARRHRGDSSQGVGEGRGSGLQGEGPVRRLLMDGSEDFPLVGLTEMDAMLRRERRQQLRHLNISVGEMLFASDTFKYDVDVPYGTGSVRLQPLLWASSAANSTVTVGWDEVGDRQWSPPQEIGEYPEEWRPGALHRILAGAMPRLRVWPVAWPGHGFPAAREFCALANAYQAVMTHTRLHSFLIA